MRRQLRADHKATTTMKKIQYFSLKSAKVKTFSQVTLGEKPQSKMILDFKKY